MAAPPELIPDEEPLELPAAGDTSEPADTGPMIPPRPEPVPPPRFEPEPAGGALATLRDKPVPLLAVLAAALAAAIVVVVRRRS